MGGGVREGSVMRRTRDKWNFTQASPCAVHDLCRLVFGSAAEQYGSALGSLSLLVVAARSVPPRGRYLFLL